LGQKRTVFAVVRLKDLSCGPAIVLLSFSFCSGTNFGYFCLYEMPNLHLISINEELQEHRITAMKFSLSSKYLCITTVPSQIVIYLWNPFLKNPQKIWSSSTRSSKIYFDWHPWIENEMAIGLFDHKKFKTKI
jgi:hypothetical protein